MQGGFLIFTSLFSICFTKRILDCHHIFGITTCGLGLVLIFWNTLEYNYVGVDPVNNNIDRREIFFGLILVLLAMIINGLYFISQQKLFKKFYINPLDLLAWEGLIGLLISIIACIIFHLIPCPDSIL